MTYLTHGARNTRTTRPSIASSERIWFRSRHDLITICVVAVLTTSTRSTSRFAQSNRACWNFRWWCSLRRTKSRFWPLSPLRSVIRRWETGCLGFDGGPFCGTLPEFGRGLKEPIGGDFGIGKLPEFGLKGGFCPGGFGTLPEFGSNGGI